MKELIEFIAKSLVVDKDAVVVTQTESPDAIIINLSVAESDMGKVIGKNSPHNIASRKYDRTPAE